MRYALMTALALGLGACSGVAVDADGNHTQAARSKELHNTGPIGSYEAVGRGECNADTIKGCGGVLDRAEYRRLAAAGKLRFSYPDGTARAYRPQ